MKKIAQRFGNRTYQMAGMVRAVEAVLAGLALYLMQCVAR